MRLKEIFIKNLSQIAPGIKQKEIAKIMGCTEGTVSKYLNPARKDLPTIEMIYSLAQHFNVSIDWLIGNQNVKKQYGENLSLRDVCKMLLAIYSRPYINTTINEISVSEECFIPDYEHGTNYTKEINTYPALYISEWCPTDNLDDSEITIIEQIGNNFSDAKYINTFLSRLREISDMKVRGNLNQEMYDRLLESYLNDVPDE